MTKVIIYTNHERNEYAICIEGDQVMRHASHAGINYPHIEGEYEITAESDLAFIDETIQDALKLHVLNIDNCTENVEFECCNCLETIPLHEAHVEIVLYAGEDEISMIAAMHNDCVEGE